MKMSSFFKKNKFTLVLLMYTLFLAVSSHSVCDLKTLLLEIKQDLADNKVLDCLREIEPLHITEETDDQRNLRLAAQWDTSCSFEASDKWMEKVLKHFGISHLVDSVGERVPKNIENQADMCEIVRAALAKNLFDLENLNLQDLNLENDKTMAFLNMIDCPGAGDNRLEGPRICAVTTGSFFQKDSWNILIGSSNLKFLGVPNFNLSNRSKEGFDPTKRINPNTLLPGAKEALKFSMQQFENKQAELGELINKYSGDKPVTPYTAIVDMNQKVIKEKSDSGLISVWLKRIETIINGSNTNYFNKSPPGQYFLFPDAVMEVPTEKPATVFAFYMVNYELDKDDKKGIFMLDFNGAPIRESKQIATTQNAVLTGAFVERQPMKTTNLGVYYNVLEYGIISESKQQTFQFGAITMPQGTVLKSFLNKSVSLSKTQKWTDFPDLNLEISSSNPQNALYIVMYSISIPLTSESFEFGTRLKYGNRAITETTSVSKGAKYFTAHGAYALEAYNGKQSLFLEYKYNGDKNIEASKADDHVYSISAFLLPKSAFLETGRLQSQLKLQEGQWRDFGFKKTISIPSSRSRSTILVLYHVNLVVHKRKLSIAFSLNGKTFKSHTYTSDKTHRANIQGYAVQILAGGTYTFDLKYLVHLTVDPALVMKNVDYDPSDKLSDESVSMQVIVLE